MLTFFFLLFKLWLLDTFKLHQWLIFLLDRLVLEKVLSIKDKSEDTGQGLWPPGVCILLPAIGGGGGGQIINSDFDNVRKQSCCEENKTEKEKLGGQLSSSSRPLRQRRQPGFTSRLNSEAGSGCLEQALVRVQGYTEPQLESRARCIGCVSSGLRSRQECQRWPRSKNGISPSIYSSQKPQP